MAPFHLPWLTFSAFLVLGATIVLALSWAGIDKIRNQSDHQEEEEC